MLRVRSCGIIFIPIQEDKATLSISLASQKNTKINLQIKMKKLLLSLLTLVSLSAFAQKDAQLTLLFPQTGTEINSGTGFPVAFSIKNIGIDSITRMDTFIVNLSINFNTIINLKGSASIKAGDSVVLTPQGGGLAVNFSGDQDTAIFCAFISFMDTMSADTGENNASCNLVKLREFPTAVAEIKALAATVKAYPNPANSYFTITMKSTDAVVEVLDITGKLVSTTPVVMGEARMDVSNYNNGIYFYQIKDAADNVVKSGKFTVSH
jgi:hypothetical protein